MTYSLSNNCTKNYYNRTLTVQVIVEDVVTWIFLKHSVEQKNCYTSGKQSVIICVAASTVHPRICAAECIMYTIAFYSGPDSRRENGEEHRWHSLEPTTRDRQKSADKSRLISTAAQCLCPWPII